MRPGASSEVIDSLRKYYAEEQLVELDVLLGVANLANRLNVSFDIEIDHAPEHLAALRKRVGRRETVRRTDRICQGSECASGVDHHARGWRARGRVYP